MKRKLLMIVLALGAIGGFAAGVASLGCRVHRHEARWRQNLKQEVTDVCTDAVRKASRAKEVTSGE